MMMMMMMMVMTNILVPQLYHHISPLHLNMVLVFFQAFVLVSPEGAGNRNVYRLLLW